MACSRVNFTFTFYQLTPARLVGEGEAVNWFQPVVLLYLDWLAVCMSSFHSD